MLEVCVSFAVSIEEATFVLLHCIQQVIVKLPVGYHSLIRPHVVEHGMIYFLLIILLWQISFCCAVKNNKTFSRRAE